MRSSSIAIGIVLFHALAACGSSGTHGGGNDGPPVTISITTGFAPALVAFRDGVDAEWRLAGKKAETAYEATVHGPYLVAVVCTDPSTTPSFSGTTTTYAGWTPDDPRALSFCRADVPRYVVTGHMVQAGFVQLGDFGTQSSSTNWNYNLTAPIGTFDLIATSADRVAVRRAITVGGDLAVTAPIDLAAEGTALVATPFTALNAAAADTVTVSVGLLNATSPNVPARIYQGPLATAKVAPDAGLLATDTQSVSVRATTATELRALRRPFRVGGDAVFALPPALDGVQWSTTGGQLSVSWGSLPELDLLIGFLGGNAAGGSTPVDYELELGSRYLAATGITHFTYETDLAGFQHAWTIDVNAAYTRQLLTQQGTELATLTTSSVAEMINQAALDGAPGPVRMPRAAAP